MPSVKHREYAQQPQAVILEQPSTHNQNCDKGGQCHYYFHTSPMTNEAGIFNSQRQRVIARASPCAVAPCRNGVGGGKEAIESWELHRPPSLDQRQSRAWPRHAAGRDMVPARRLSGAVAPPDETAWRMHFYTTDCREFDS